MQSGPNASGVIFSLPIPQTSALPSGIRTLSSSQTVRAKSLSTTAPQLKLSASIVMYLPFGLRIARSPRLFITSIEVIFAPFLVVSFIISPSSVCGEISRRSIARSVRKLIKITRFRFIFINLPKNNKEN